MFAALGLVLLAGCDAGQAPAPAKERADSRTEPSAPQPVIDQDFPDPDVLFVDGIYYAYATQRADGSRNVQLATSTDLSTWQVAEQDALPTLPSWATSGRTWAPDVTAVGAGFVMYVTARNADTSLQCIGAATSSSPRGPFEPVEGGPLICPERRGGAIDPASFIDGRDTRYLLWKNDGNCCGKPTWLHLQRLSTDGLRTAGPPRRLIREDQPWEGDLVEAPTLVRRGDTYVLFYSANSYSGEQYATGYAVADRRQGPYRKADEPLLTTENTDVTGPGGQDVVTDSRGRTFILFHGWDPAVVYRGMYVLPLAWRNDRPVRPTAEPASGGER
jgi:arabinan endo-1,5-alpha-L-arabinosidase